MLQLAPLNLTQDARSLADEALTVAGSRGRRIIISRPWAQSLGLVRSGFYGADLVVAIGEAVTSTVRCAAPVVYIPNGVPSQGEVRALRRMGNIHLLASSGLAGASLQRLGVRFSSSHVVRPDMRLPRRRSARDEVLREELGIRPTDRLVFAPGAARRDSGHYEALWATSILSFATEGQWKLLVSGEGAGMSNLLKFALGNHPSALLLAHDLLSDFTPAAGLEACDLAVDFGTGSSDVVSILQAQAVGVPIVVGRDSSAAEVVAAEAIATDLTSRALASKIREAVETVPPPYPTQRTAGGKLEVLLGRLQTAELPVGA